MIGKVKLFLEFLKNLWAAIKQGQTLRANKKMVKKRLDICDFCEKAKTGICQECGCVLAVKTKIKVSGCPVGRW